MERLAGLPEDEVGDVDHVVDRALPDRREPGLQPLGAGTDPHAFDRHGDVARAAGGILESHPHPRGALARQRGAGGLGERSVERGGELAGETDVAHAVGPVAGDVDVEHEIVEGLRCDSVHQPFAFDGMPDRGQSLRDRARIMPARPRARRRPAARRRPRTARASDRRTPSQVSCAETAITAASASLTWRRSRSSFSNSARMLGMPHGSSPPGRYRARRRSRSRRRDRCRSSRARAGRPCRRRESPSSRCRADRQPPPPAVGAGDVHLARRLGEREVARPQADGDVGREEPRQERLERALEVGQRDPRSTASPSTWWNIGEWRRSLSLR